MIRQINVLFKAHLTKILLGLYLLISIVWLAPTHAQAFSLGAFEEYGLLVNNGATGGNINTFPINANIGIGYVTSPINIDHGIIDGRIDCAGTLESSIKTGGPLTMPDGSPVIMSANVAAVLMAIDQATSLSGTYGTFNGTRITVDGTQTIEARNGILYEGAHVFTVDGNFSIGNGNTLTINGSKDEFVVINISAVKDNMLNGGLVLTGGITSDHVLVNFTGNGGMVMGTAGETLYGTFLMPDLRVQLNNVTINGRLFGAGPDNDPFAKFNFVTNSLINQPDAPPVPIPASALLMLSGTGFVGGFRFFRRQKRPLAV